MDRLINLIVDSIHFGYAFAVIIASYGIIKILDENTKKPLSDKVKKACTYIIGLILFFMYKADGVDEAKLITSYIVATVLYDFFIKWLLRKCDLHYKDEMDSPTGGCKTR